jgi:hypothetical protein
VSSKVRFWTSRRQTGSNPDTHQIGTGRFPSTGPTGHQLAFRDPSLTASLERLALEK